MTITNNKQIRVAGSTQRSYNKPKDVGEEYKESSFNHQATLNHLPAKAKNKGILTWFCCGSKAPNNPSDIEEKPSDKPKHNNILSNLKPMLKSYNKSVAEDQRITEHEVKLALEKFASATEFPVLIPKSETRINHSILLYRDDSGYHILIKPAIQIGAKVPTHPNVKQGSNKTVKTSGFKIHLNLQQEYTDSYRVVTSSRSPDDIKKGDGLESSAEEMLSDEFTRVDFQDHKLVNRTIFLKRHLGDDLLSLVEDNKLKRADKVKIINQLCNQLTDAIGDIKLANTAWDGQQATFFDTKGNIFSFTSRTSGNNGRPIGETAIRQQVILGASLLFYQLLSENSWQHPSGVSYKATKKSRLTLDADNKFAKLLEQAYEEKIDSLKDFKEAVGKIMKTL